MKRQLLLVTAGVALTTLLAGCNTVSGVGKDMQAGGQAITQSADKAAPAPKATHAKHKRHHKVTHTAAKKPAPAAATTTSTTSETTTTEQTSSSDSSSN